MTTTGPRLICCGILREEIEQLLKAGRIDVEPYFLSANLHRDYGLLEKGLTGAIEKSKKKCHGGIVVAYGDVCLGFNNEMKELIDAQGVIKVDALNCIDCLLGGGGKLLEIDPEHKYFFLNPAFIKFGEDFFSSATPEEAREKFKMLDGIILLDALGNLDEFTDYINKIAEYTALPVIERKKVGLEGLRDVVLKAVGRLK